LGTGFGDAREGGDRAEVARACGARQVDQSVLPGCPKVGEGLACDHGDQVVMNKVCLSSNESSAAGHDLPVLGVWVMASCPEDWRLVLLRAVQSLDLSRENQVVCGEQMFAVANQV
jgi:hypothetical protein